MTSTGPIDRMWTSPDAFGKQIAPPFDTTRSKSAVFEAASAVPAPMSELARSVPLRPNATARRVNQLMNELLSNWELACAGCRRRARAHIHEARFATRGKRRTG